MMRSMFTGVSGLRIHQTKMDVIANNIANVNTVGYKSSRVTFNEVFSQTLNGASQANDAVQRGGINPMQIGLGGNVASIDKLMTTGAAQRTDNPLDVMIQGDGFFIVGDNSGTYFTRAGVFDLDEVGNLVNPSGLKVMGWDRTYNGTTWVIEKGAVKPIQISGNKEYAPPVATTAMEIQGNFGADKVDTNDNIYSKMEIYDTVGNRYTIDVQYHYDKANQVWEQRLSNVAYVNGEKDKPYSLTITAGTATTNPTIEFEAYDDTIPQAYVPDAGAGATSYLALVKFDTNGNLVGVSKVPGTAPTYPAPNPNTNAMSFNYDIVAAPGVLAPDARFGDASIAGGAAGAPQGGVVSLSFLKATGFAGDTSKVATVKLNGNKPGKLIGMTIGSDGIITGRYSNGDVFPLAQIAVAKFANPAGLEKVGDNLFAATANSGDFDGVGLEVQDGGGKMMGGVLEMANVDLGYEFTEMITTQRGFQANSRVITVSDEMLQELVNLKR